MPAKPDRITAMQNILAQVKAEFPLTDPELTVCGDKTSCLGCPKKLLEIVDSEVCFWEAALAQGEVPNFGEISRFAKLCKNVRRGLVRNNIL